MSLLHPGGCRDVGYRMFDAKEIARSCKAAKGRRDHAAIAQTSIAAGSRHRQQNFKPMAHEHRREKARHLGQIEGAR